MNSQFLFGIDDSASENKKTLKNNDRNSNEIVKYIKEEVDHAHTQLSNLNEQVSKIDFNKMENCFLLRKCSLVIEYLNNVYAFHMLKNSTSSEAKQNVLRRLNNIKSILDRLPPLESRLTNYLKNANKNAQKRHGNTGINPAKSDLSSQMNSSVVDLAPNLSALEMNNDDIGVDDLDEAPSLQPNLSNLAPVVDEASCQKKINDSENECDTEFANDYVPNSESSAIHQPKTSLFIPSKSRYMPYDDLNNSQLTSRKRKEISEQSQHREHLHKTIVDDLLNLENDAPRTYGMKETNNAGYFEKNNPFSKASSRKDMQMVKDRRLVLMMNDVNDDGEFVDKSMEQLADNMSKKLNSKKHKAKLIKRKSRRTIFRKKMAKRR